ncbi:MAG: hypothetical protein HFI41_12360 [Lachnospiraceae bacterium]|nr:hypothetical protein [Lachnospiraceae bacterium]
MIRPEITEEERKEEYSGLFFKPMEPVEPKLLEIMGKGPVDPDCATAIQNRNDILKPGYLAVENGYCRMADGSGFVATKVEMPGVTQEMVDWWFIWHGLKDLRYKVWCPTQHYGIHVLERDLPKRLNQALSFKQRNWGTTDVVTEDVGDGPKTMHLTFLSPEDYGYDPSLVPNAEVIVSANVTEPETGLGLITFSHVIRRIPHGIEYRSHYWQGYQINEHGEAVKTSVPEGGFSMEIMKGCAYHSLEEYHNLAVILPKLYGMYRDRQDRLEDYSAKA